MGPNFRRIPGVLLRGCGVAGLALGLSLACSSSSDDGGPRVPYDIVLVPNHPAIPQGLTLKLTATVVDANGRAINGQTPVFSSSDESVITVDPDGTMHSVGPLGSAQVTADLDGLTHAVDVDITQRVVALVVLPESLLINPTLGGQLFVSMADFAGNPVSPTGLVSFQVADPQVATVDQFGGVAAGANPGRTIVSVRVDTFQVDVPIRVAQIPQTINVDPTNVVLQAGASRQLSVTVLDLAGHPIANPLLDFTSNAPAVFTVSSTGLVTSVGGTGGGQVHIVTGSLSRDVGVFISNGVPVALVHTTQTGLAMYQAAFGPSGELVVTAPNDNKAVRGTLPAFTLPTTYSTADTPFGVAVNHAGTRAYVCERDKLSGFDLSSNLPLTPIPIQGGGTKVAVVISADDTKAYVGGQDRIYVVDLIGGAVVDSMQATVGGAFFLALHPDGQRLYASEGSVREIDLATRAVLRTFPGVTAGKEVAVSPDGAELYVADEGAGVARVFSLATGTSTETLTSAGGAFGLAVSGDLIAVGNGSVVTLYDRASKVQINEIQVGGTVRRLAISADGKTVAVPNEGGWVDFIQ